MISLDGYPFAPALGSLLLRRHSFVMLDVMGPLPFLCCHQFTLAAHLAQSELSGYSSCIDRQSSEEYMFERCRREQAALSRCRSAAARVPADAAPVVAAAATEEK